jgi:TonB family protein
LGVRVKSTGILAAIFSLAMVMAASCARADETPLQGADVHLSLRDPGVKFYPEAAQRARLEGHATALCLIAPNGDLTKCDVVEETPADLGFGRGVVRLAEHMRADLKAKDGSPTPGRQFLFKLTFRLPK